MTQFFQVLKLFAAFYIMTFCFMMTQFFQVLKRVQYIDSDDISFMMTQFFQVLKLTAGVAPSVTVL